MSTTWHRARSPDEVPTPIAVALSDFCRRAQAPATPAEVREALSALSPDDDFRVRALSEEGPSPEARWTPLAAVDLVRGTRPALVAQRLGCGYYDLARELIAASDQPLSSPEEAPMAPEAPAPAAAPRVSRAKAKAEALGARIAPRVRSAAEADPLDGDLDAEQSETGSAALPRRDLPKPRGRFTSLPPSRASLQELSGREGRATLEALVEQHPHRFSLLRAVASQYSGPKGAEVSAAELEVLLDQQALAEQLHDRERRAVLNAYAEHRGANGRVAWALSVSPSELDQLIARLTLTEQVDQLRERFREEALSPRTLAARIDMLGREKYLQDLGIQKRFRRQLESDLREELDRARTEAPDVDPVDQVARWHAAPIELVQRAVERLGLRPRAG